MSKLVLEIEAGRSIQDAANEAQRLANMTDTTVMFDFNGVECHAVPGGCAKALAANQRAEQVRKPRAYSDR